MDKYIRIHQTPRGLLSGRLPDVFEDYSEDKYQALAWDLSEILRHHRTTQNLFYKSWKLDILEYCDQNDIPEELMENELQNLQEWLGKILEEVPETYWQFVGLFFLETNTTLVVYKNKDETNSKTSYIPTKAEILDLTQRLGCLV